MQEFALTLHDAAWKFWVHYHCLTISIDGIEHLLQLQAYELPRGLSSSGPVHWESVQETLKPTVLLRSSKQPRHGLSESH